ncbi:MAG: fused MFS/spermidine synthase [Bacteroidia bacterium]|jgi:spermidine synthase|nr:fused MFS/spermidine synthase [Bacteroidia bacterium]
MDFLKQLGSFVAPVLLRSETGHITSTLEVVYENGRKMLHAQTVNYSFGALHDVFRAALKKAGVPRQNPATVLILGYGAGSIAQILTSEFGLTPQITGVDADETVLKLAREEFNADTVPNQTLVCERAENFLATQTNTYDLICVDLFVEAHVPPQCQTQTFVNLLHQSLSKNGVLLFNFMRHTTNGHLFLQQNLARVFTHTEPFVMHLGEADNVVWICRK